MLRIIVLGVFVVLTTGCKHYWVRPDTNAVEFAEDSRDCILQNRVGSTQINESGYKGCLVARGYVREERPERPPHGFRGATDEKDQITWVLRQAAQPTSPSAATPRPASLSGTYSGGISGNSRGEQWAMTVVFTVVQSGTLLTGLWNTTGGTSGGLSGVLGESGIPQLTIHQINPCEGDFHGVAVVEAGGTRLRGSYVGQDCNGQVTGSFLVDRQY